MFKTTTYTITTADLDTADRLILARDLATARFFLRAYMGDIEEMAAFAIECAEGADEVTFIIAGKRYEFFADDDGDGFWLIPEEGKPEPIADCDALMTRLHRQGEVSVTVKG